MSLKIFSIILISITVAVLSTNPPATAPVWPDQFEQTFDEFLSYPVIGSHTTKGKFFYDFPNRRYRIDREDGHYDRYCGPIYPFSSTPCSQIVVNGNRYIHYPEKDYCCYCCSNEHGCGVLKPDWLNGATFVEYSTDQTGTVLEKWNKKGLQNNFYYATADNRIMKSIDQVPNDVQDYDVSSFTNKITDPSVFDLPAKCRKDSVCPTFSTCTAVRKSSTTAFLQ